MLLITTGLPELFKLGREPKVLSVIWVQGENDGAVQEYADAYYTNLVALYNGIKAVIGDNFKMLITQLSILSLDDDSPGKEVREAQALFVANYPNAYLIDTSDATFYDGSHYDTAYSINMSNRQYAILENVTPVDTYLDKIFPEGYTKTYYSPQPV